MDAADKGVTSENRKSSQGDASDTSKNLNKSGKSSTSEKSNLTAKSNKLGDPNEGEQIHTTNKLRTQEMGADNFDANDDKANQYKRFLQNSCDEFTIQQMEKFLKHGIADNGIRMMTTNNCSWLYDYYKTTKTSIPPIKELTEDTTVDYYYHTTPFSTQIGDINLVMMNSRVNFGDQTCTPADRVFKMNAVTPQMIKEAKIKSLRYKNECMDWI
ncbi:hypothetical protein, conserved [Plasmodium ovale wallikeri]|uniref:Uncharacterized protein n=1 Tax=Plasmodium ovale wallikeri TaxID=864142 RepID=A0A1A8YXC7_PLAOA|nr:hypothetical protein, conserved [Plasmodium ovale wallikeri]SBT36632.1 hypothetical protein, conserved [Plasmodium ovale wallikeri]